MRFYQRWFKPKLPRLAGTILLTLLITIAVGLFSPQQLPLSLYKLSLVTTAGIAGYYLDRAIFPYARPDSYLHTLEFKKVGGNPDEVFHKAHVRAGLEVVFAIAMLRRAIIVGCAMLAIGLGA